MSEFNIPLLTKTLLIESRILEYAQRKRTQFLDILRKLTYTRYSWRLIHLMLQISPGSTVIIILGRFIEGILPSLDLKIKGGFLDMVFLRVGGC